MLDYVIQYSGLNFAKFYNLIVNQSISIKNIIKLDYKTIKFSVGYNGYKKLILSDCFKNYNISIIKKGGLSLVKDMLISKIGIFIGLIITIILAVMLSNITLNIVINGSSVKDDIYNELNNYGIKLFKINKFNCNDLEMYLINNVPSISMVDIINNGSSIIINVNESTFDSDNKYLPIVASYDMYISSIEVYSGTSAVFKDSVVRKGDTLVYPYITDNYGNINYVEPKAKVEADIWFSDYKVYDTVSYDNIKTGKNKLLEYKIMFNDIVLYSYIGGNTYSSYLEESYEYQLLNSSFIPITIYKRYAYETTIKESKHNFELDKDGVVASIMDSLSKTIPNDYNIIDKQIEISQINDKYYIVVYLKCSIIIVY